MKNLVMKKKLLFPTLCLGVGKGQGCKTLEIDIELRKTEYTNWDTMEKEIGYEFSACGSGLGSCGQCLDRFKKHAEQYIIDESRKELFNRVFEIWDKYHLNTLKPGTKRQTEFLNDKRRSKEDYTERCAFLKDYNLYDDNGYKYGHGWLGQPIPEDIIAEILSWNDVENYSKEELSQIRRKLIREYKRENKRENK